LGGDAKALTSRKGGRRSVHRETVTNWGRGQLSLRWRKPRGKAITSAGNLPIEAEQVLKVLMAPEKAGGVYRVLSVNPKMINSPADYPGQKMSIPEGAR